MIALTAHDVLSSSGEHPDREVNATPQQRANAAEVAARVTALFAEIGLPVPVVSSGLRTPEANAAAGGAKFSAHLEGKAVDLVDSGKKISSRITPALLLKHQLRREDNDSTPTWCHLDTRQPWGSIFSRIKYPPSN